MLHLVFLSGDDDDDDDDDVDDVDVDDDDVDVDDAVRGPPFFVFFDMTFLRYILTFVNILFLKNIIINPPTHFHPPVSSSSLPSSRVTVWSLRELMKI